MKLQQYIDVFYGGSNTGFAVAQGVKPQQVTQWKNNGFIVVEHVLYSPRRELAEVEPSKRNIPLPRGRERKIKG
ncbi:TPA: hypothetical protein JG825_003459 [Vibrio parahaemolyticus]|nr:hypothetical protein [Vibrio parahaemolyticus]UPR19106.1 hypothetical protein H9J99_25885 [Vibrio parahaemolyticus]HAV1520140.1 hypothetical protein [Vibrio parahaemolyticus]HAV1539107.1 hypothetical protein [Vibrio parahaemolyticus]